MILIYFINPYLDHWISIFFILSIYIINHMEVQYCHILLSLTELLAVCEEWVVMDDLQREYHLQLLRIYLFILFLVFFSHNFLFHRFYPLHIHFLHIHILKYHNPLLTNMYYYYSFIAIKVWINQSLLLNQIFSIGFFN